MTLEPPHQLPRVVLPLPCVRRGGKGAGAQWGMVHVWAGTRDSREMERLGWSSAWGLQVSIVPDR